jgi:hypothetical protein
MFQDLQSAKCPKLNHEVLDWGFVVLVVLCRAHSKNEVLEIVLEVLCWTAFRGASKLNFRVP